MLLPADDAAAAAMAVARALLQVLCPPWGQGRSRPSVTIVDLPAGRSIATAAAAAAAAAALERAKFLVLRSARASLGARVDQMRTTPPLDGISEAFPRPLQCPARRHMI
jgi:hypothetical protein